MYYLSLHLEKEGKDFNQILGKAVEVLENPGLVDPRIIGLSNDPISRRTRVRAQLNLYSIYMKLGDVFLAEKNGKKPLN